MERLTVQDPVIVVLASGETPSAVNNARGHLFERFIARLLQEYGYDQSFESDLNVTSEGIEIDLVASHSLSGHAVMVEAKAYSGNVRARILTDFYGALSIYRMDHPGAYGYLFITPRLVPDGEEQARKAMSGDPKFRYLNSVTIADRLKERGLLQEPDLSDAVTSDPAILITEEGVFGALKVLDDSSRIAESVAVWASNGRTVPKPVLNMLSEHDYAFGLEVYEVGKTGRNSQSIVTHSDPSPIVVPVRGSTSDFDPFPASPKNFVGRTSYVNSLRDVIAGKNGVFVLNAQSGWGKSSLALRAKQLVEGVGGYAAVLDSRTAVSPRYVAEVIRRCSRDAEDAGLIRLSSNQSWASLSSAISSVEEAERLRDAPLMIFFDQFENVFQQEATTREFRDLALRVSHSSASILVGFAWKTDIVSWTESHPFRFRDEIRGSGQQILVSPMGPRDVELLLQRLEKQLPEKLSRELRQRLREYSQGYPWLFKKLANHVISEINSGQSQEQLVSEALNVQNLFGADMAGLGPVETDALKYVARFAPVSANEVTDRYSAGVVQSLLDSRLAVAVGDKLDTYWDIFRDFLNTGRVPIEDGYIVRLNPSSVGRLLAALIVRGGDESVSNLALALRTSEAVIFNLARELRIFGLSTYESNRVKLISELIDADDQEEFVRGRVESALRRHRAYTLLLRLFEKYPKGLPLTIFAQELEHAFVAVKARPGTWQAYARAFAQWFDYAGLSVFSNAGISPPEEGAAGKGQLLGDIPPRGRGAGGVHISPGPVLSLLTRVVGGDVDAGSLTTKEWRYLSLLTSMKLVRVSKSGRIEALEVGQGGVTPARIRSALEELPGLSAALSLLESNPRASAIIVGNVVRETSGANWNDATTALVGKQIRSWARNSGIKVSRWGVEHVEG